MNERLLKLRKDRGLSQEQLGQILGVSRSAISNMETGRFGITDTMIKLLTSSLDVNEKWLRTGDGPMYISLSPGDELPQLMAIITSKLHNDPEKQEIMVEILKLMKDLDKPYWDAFISIAKSLKKIEESK